MLLNAKYHKAQKKAAKNKLSSLLLSLSRKEVFKYFESLHDIMYAESDDGENPLTRDIGIKNNIFTKF